MADGSVLHASSGPVHVLRYLGEVRYPMAPSLARFVDELLQQASIPAFVIDLSAVETIDSTNLGLLARLANRLRERGGPRATIIVDGGELPEVLQTMAFDEVFDIVREPPPQAETVPTPEPVEIDEYLDRQAVGQTVLEAHRNLMAMSEHNREVFEEVVAAFERQDAAND